ncbi:MAG: YggS family pyridoxal phosphate-dependent enzyme [Flavobacteriales bacterium]|nr:YggS family pyridoxal phosphate-dependent enzyme [Flavobacteriales bacterium]
MTAVAKDIQSNLTQIKDSLPEHVTLVAVSKTHPVDAIEAAYATGQRIFGENKVQDMVAKYETMAKDIQWHLIGHLQTNKVKYIAPFVSMIHAVDSEKLLSEINKRAKANDRVIDVLLQLHIAQESTKFGMNDDELNQLLEVISTYENVRVRGLMGMATFTDDESQVAQEFQSLKVRFDAVQAKGLASLTQFDTLSMGMSGDYSIAIAEGSTMVRVGSSIFGQRHYG